MGFDLEYNENEAKEAGKVGGFEPLPNGVYKLACIKCEQYQTKGSDKSPSHAALKAEFVVADGEFEGRHLFVNYIRASGDKRPELHAWYKMTGMTTKVSEAADFVGSEITAAVIVSKRKAYTNPATGKSYPESLENQIVFSIDDPSKIAKSAKVPTVDATSQASATKTVDNSSAW